MDKRHAPKCGSTPHQYPCDLPRGWKAHTNRASADHALTPSFLNCSWGVIGFHSGMGSESDWQYRSIRAERRKRPKHRKFADSSWRTADKGRMRPTLQEGSRQQYAARRKPTPRTRNIRKKIVGQIDAETHQQWRGHPIARHPTEYAKLPEIPYHAENHWAAHRPKARSAKLPSEKNAATSVAHTAIPRFFQKPRVSSTPCTLLKRFRETHKTGRRRP